MKRILTAAVLVGLGLLILCQPALAQPDRQREGRMGQMRDQMRGQFMTKERIMGLLEQLDLKPEQKEKIDVLVKEFDQKAEEGRKKLEEINEKMKEAREGGDREKIAALEQQRREAMMGGMGQTRDLLEKIKKELGPEQLKKLEELQRPQPAVALMFKTIQERAEELKLTDRQLDEIKQLAKKYEEEKPKEGEAGRDAAATREKIQKLRESGAGEDEIRQAMRESMEQARQAREKAEKRDQEYRTEIGKILDKDQMNQLAEILKKMAPPAPDRPRPGEGPDRPVRERRGGGDANPAEGRSNRRGGENSD